MENTNIKDGIILIPDFSGFTEFVFNTKLYTGEYIVRQLLSTLIDMNNEYFEISEIEGDAILFYRYDENPSYQKISRMLRNMQNAFTRKVEELSKSLSTAIDLSLNLSFTMENFHSTKSETFRNYMENLSWKPIKC